MSFNLFIEEAQVRCRLDMAAGETAAAATRSEDVSAIEIIEERINDGKDVRYGGCYESAFDATCPLRHC